MISPSQKIVIVGDPNNKDTKQILIFLRSTYLQHSNIILKDPKDNNSLLEKIIPWITNYDQINGKTTVYICKNRTCHKHTTDLNEIKIQLD